MKLPLSSFIIPLVLGPLLMTGCGGGKVVVASVPTAAPPAAVAVPTSTVMVDVPVLPPRPTSDTVVATSGRPGSDYVFIEGYYNWDGARYQWVPSAWVRAPQPSAVWVPAHWQPTTGGYVWVGGSWR